MTKRSVARYAMVAGVVAGVGMAAQALYRPSGREGSVRPGKTATPSAETKYQCPMHPQIVQSRPGRCPICAMELQPMAAEEQVPAGGRSSAPLYYRHPMNPSVTSPVPAKDDMGMPFLPVYEEAGPSAVEGRAPVTVSLYKQQLIGVSLGRVERRLLTQRIDTTGRIAYDPHLYQVQAEYLAAVRAKRLAVQSPVPGAAERAEGLLGAARTQLRLLGLSEEQIEALAQSGSPDDSLLLTPSSGTVWMYADIFEGELPLIRVGDAVEASLPAQPGERFSGRVAAVDPNLDMRTRSARVRVELTSPEGMLRPGMYVNAVLFAEAGERLTVPRSAVLDTGRRQLVFVSRGEGRFEPREVRLGLRGAEGIEVIAGLREGEQVVTSGNFLIDAESQLRGAASGTAFYGGRGAAEGLPGRAGAEGPEND